MLKIRLTRRGKKKQPSYRIVIAEHTAPIQGKFISIIGTFDPFTKKVVLDKKETEEWLKKGAKPSNTVAKILKKEGLTHKSIVIKTYKAKSKSQLEEEKKQKEEEKAKEMAEKEKAKAEFELKQTEDAKQKAEEAASETPAETKENAESPSKEEGSAPKTPAADSGDKEK